MRSPSFTIDCSETGHIKPSHPPATLPHFGARLRQMRRALGVKQTALCDAVGVNQSTLSRWEAGIQIPDESIQKRVFHILGSAHQDDFALRRLIEYSTQCVHLIDDISHKCLAYSPKRAKDWKSGDRDLNGTYLWQFATPEIQKAEAHLEQHGWWSEQYPTAFKFHTSERKFDQIAIQSGMIMWERMHLSDGTAVRLTTAL